MENKLEIIKFYQERMMSFEKEAHSILSIHESVKKSRVVLLHESFKKLESLSLKEEMLFKEALNCIEYGFYRSAIVLSWVGFMQFIFDKIEEYGLNNVSSLRPAWNYKSIDEMGESQPDYAIIEFLMVIGFCSKTEMKALKGLLNKRNECAHPSGHNPDLNESLGYVSDIFKRIEKIQNKIT